MTRREPRVRCVLSFDYELFHGSNRSGYESVLFGPTERILDLCDELATPVTFFPDVCSAWWHRENGDPGFADRFEAQLREAVRRGHDVQLHLHPHWLGCQREGGSEGRFHTDAARMFLHELGWGDGADEAPALVRRGVAYLEALLRDVDPTYRCTGFRAAALALQPDEGRLLRTLLDAGIRLDSSVVKGVHSDTDTFVMDYRDVPARANWWMAPESGLAEAAKGVWELPVGSFRAPLDRRLAFLWRRARAVRERRGEPMSRSETQTRLGSLWHLLRMNLRYVGGNPWFTLSFDTKGFDLDMLLSGLVQHVERHAGERELAVSVINHPKLMFDPQMALMGDFVTEARRRFGDRIEFTTCARALAAAPTPDVPAEPPPGSAAGPPAAGSDTVPAPAGR